MSSPKDVRSIQVHVVNSFTLDGGGGNPAGVVLDASGLTTIQRQQIASELQLSETAFLERAADGTYRLEFFTPICPIQNCGHATIAAFALLRSEGLENREVVDVVISNKPVKIYYDADRVFMEQRGPIFSESRSTSLANIAEALGLTENALLEHFAPTIVDTGNRFLLVGLRNAPLLASVRPQLDRIHEISEKERLVGFYVFAQQEDRFAASARMFAPLFGISEESATGMAAGPLACALIQKLNHPARELKIIQGEFMPQPSPSEILVKVEGAGSQISRLLVGGQARTLIR